MRVGILLAVQMAALLITAAPAEAQERVNRANWPLANRFSGDFLRQYVYSTSITPRWINNTDAFWYSWRDSSGTRFMYVDPRTRAKRPLFDHVKMAAQLSEMVRKPYEAHTLPITTITFNDKADTLRFVVESIRFEYDLATETLRETGRVRRGETAEPEAQPQQQQQRGQGGAQQGQPNQQDFRNFAPDRKAYVYAQDHNLYFVEVGKENEPIQLTKDGAQWYSFGSRGTGQQQQQDRRERDDQEQEQQEDQQQERQQQNRNERRVRPSVTWSRDSKSFYVTRSDSRKVQDLFLVNSLSQPRPTLMTYKYAMPGEENVSQIELHVFDRDKKELRRLPVEKWKDQRLFDLHWPSGEGNRLRLVRRDRLQRNLELIEVDLTSDKIATLITESVENAFLERQNVRYVRPGGDMIWYTERSGWGHFLLFDHHGKLKNAITSGPWRAESISHVDADKGWVWFTAAGRDLNVNPYYIHMYRSQLDGKNLTLLTPYDADHAVTLSPTRNFAVSTCSRVDKAPKAMLWDDKGKAILELEETDLSRLRETGWQMPETFRVKAADGVTDIYGNMWRPFDFSPHKKYPIILHVYPGPQTESVTSTFSASASNQRLAQLGFVVVQIGNRGGNPRRSNAYHSYGYFNLRDYGLADKKSGVEQLASRHPWIDIDRVGIYGHSGGGFMTAAALLLPPYNEFFKVGVSSAGNHDNNVYNQNWSEQHHGLREVAKKDKDGKEIEGETTFEIKVPTNHELAANLKGKLLLVHGDMDNNVHPAGTIRLVDALIKAGKRFDFMLMPGQAHGFGPMQSYFQQMMYEYFAEHLMGDYYRDGADMRIRN
jgi:dipeptidyl-peptidase 4